MNSPRSSSTPSPAYGSSTVFWHARRARPGAGGVSVRVLGLALAGGGATSLALAPSCTEFIGCEKVRKCPADGGMGGELSSSGGMTSGGSLSGGFAGETSTGGAAPTGKPSTGGQQGTGGAPPPPECEGITCQDDASCTLDDGEPVCECNTGFEADGDACTDVNECEDDPCGEGGECENETGGYSCSCAPGFYEDLGACWPDMVLVSAVGPNLGAPGGVSPGTLSADGRKVTVYGLGADFGLDSDDERDALYQDLRGGSIELLASLPSGESDGQSGGAFLSADGTKVAFGSNSPNLVEGDTNDTYDVFVRTVGSQEVTRVSVSSSGTQADGSSSLLGFGGAGRWVVFGSQATNLVPETQGSTWRLYVRDLEAQTTKRLVVSHPDSTGTSGCSDARLAPDGRFVVLWCGFATYTYDLELDTFEFVADGTDQANPMGTSSLGAISDGGRFVVYEASDGSNLDVVRRDMVEGTTKIVDVNPAGEATGEYRQGLGISADGRYVLFSSGATDLVAGDTNELVDIFVRDMIQGTTIRVNTGPDGQQANAGWIFPPARLSGDGRFVLFATSATNFGADPQGAEQVWYKRILP